MTTSALFTAPDRNNKTHVVNLQNGSSKEQLVSIMIFNTDDGSTGLDNVPVKQETRFGEYGEIAALLTGLNLTTQVRQNVTYTLGNNIYLYVFGESVYNLTISGYGFLPCNSDTPVLKAFTDLINFYRDNNVAREGKYCNIYMDDKTFKGYLIQSDIGLTDQTPSLVPFKFNFIGIFQE